MPVLSAPTGPERSKKVQFSSDCVAAAAPADTPAHRLPASAQVAATGLLHRVASAQSTATLLDFSWMEPGL